MPTISRDLADRIAAAILNSDLTKEQVAERSGIASTTLRRKLKGVGTFDIVEVFLIATVIHVQPWELLPDSFRADAA